MVRKVSKTVVGVSHHFGGYELPEHESRCHSNIDGLAVGLGRKSAALLVLIGQIHSFILEATFHEVPLNVNIVQSA